MKIMKKLAVALLAVVLVCPCFANVAFAADGVAFFTDLETKVGDEFTVTGTVVAKNDVIGDAVIEMTYDTEFMRFVSGDDGVENSSGTITFEGSGDGSSDRLTFDMTFQALAEGDTQMDQTAAIVTTSSGETVNCTMGYSAISIGEGDPSKIQDIPEEEEGETGELTFGGVSYEISEVFSEGEIPAGFSATEVTYAGKTFDGITHSVAGINALFATDSDGLGKFFIVAAEDKLYPLEQFVISDSYSIFILDGTSEVKMPEKYEEAVIGINGVDYPVWIEPSREGFYIFYAMNQEGTKSLYLYDSTEHTYQRMETPKTAESEENEVNKLDKTLAVVEEHLVWFVVGASCAIIVLVILSIVLAVKLKHRNLELDDLYDEYGIDVEEEEAAKPKRELDLREVKEEKDYLESDEFDDNEYDDDEYEYDDDEYEYDDDEYEYDDDEYEYDDDEYEDDADDYYEEDDLAELRRDFNIEQPVSTNSNFDSYYDDDDFEEDDEYYVTPSKVQLKRNDTFEMDFIDLE